MLNLLFKRGSIFVFLLAGSFAFSSCQKSNDLTDSSSNEKPKENPDFGSKSTQEDPTAVHFPMGTLQMVQVGTSDKVVQINILVPKLKTYSYEVKILNTNEEADKVNVQVLESVKNEAMYWYVDKIQIENLKPNVAYKLLVKDRKSIIDEREFSSLDINKNNGRFIMGSCMADDIYFEAAQAKMWDRIVSLNPDFLLLMGDLVYVDSFAFVPRENATENDLWTRYIDTMRTFKFYRSKKLFPVFAVWDDHDFGTNDSNKNFVSKNLALKVFKAFFGSKDIPGFLENGPTGVSFKFKLFGQNFIMVDDRFDRDPDGTEGEEPEFGEWGENQYKWVIDSVKKETEVSWLINGGQYFTPAIYSSSGKKINESMFVDHPKQFNRLMSDLKNLNQKVLFGAGDIHFSEISEIESSVLGYQTYEITSSPVHSYLASGDSDLNKDWPNPRRRAAYRGHNIVLVETSNSSSQLNAHLESWGISNNPYFAFDFSLAK